MGCPRFASASGDRKLEFIKRGMIYRDLRDDRLFDKSKYRFVKDRVETRGKVEYFYTKDFPHSQPLMSSERFTITYNPQTSSAQYRSIREALEACLTGCSVDPDPVVAGAKYVLTIRRSSDTKVIFSAESAVSTLSVPKIVYQCCQYG